MSLLKLSPLTDARVGCLVVVQRDSTTTAAVLSLLTEIASTEYSNPPAYGSQIVDAVLLDAKLSYKWTDDLWMMTSRIRRMRAALVSWLVQLGTPITWMHITDQIGFLAYTGLSETQLRVLIEKYHIFVDVVRPDKCVWLERE